MKSIRYFLWAILMVVAFCTHETNAQIPTRVSKVRFTLNETAKVIEITYNLANNSPLDSIFVEVRKRDNSKILAKSLSGDLGLGISAGNNKKIVWNIMADSLRINEEISINVNLKVGGATIIAKKEPVIAVIPSIIKSQKQRSSINMISLLILVGGVSGGGYMAYYGSTQKTIADKYYEDYKSNNWNQKTFSTTPSSLKLYEQQTVANATADLEKANDALKKSRIFLYGGIAVAVIDAFFTIPRLISKKNTTLSISPNISPLNGMEVSLKMKF